MINETVLPNDWEVVKLDEIGKIVSGGTPSTKIAEYWNGSISWITPADLSGYGYKVILSGRKNISESGINNSSARLIPKGSVLFSSRAPIGYVAIAGKELSTNQGFKSIIPGNRICSDYLYYCLRASKQYAEANANGTTFKEISLKAFAQLKIPLPPLPEQHRIVAKIEELFSDLDNGVESLKATQQQLKVYREAVLKYAFEGRFTNANVKEGELPEGWKRSKLIELSELITKGASPKWQGFNYIDDSSQLLFVTSENVRDNYIDISSPKFLAKEFNNIQKRSILKKGDVLFNLVGASIGRAAVYNSDTTANINQAVAIIRLKTKLNNKYLSYFLNSEGAKQKYLDKVVDFARANLSLTDTNNICIPHGSIEDQQFVISEIESRLSVCDKVEETIEASLLQSESLRQSTLKKAFEGRLL